MVGGHTMEPNHRIAGPNLCVYWIALAVSFDATRRKSEDLDKKVMRRWYVLVYKKSYQSINHSHVLPAYSFTAGVDSGPFRSTSR